MSRKSSRVGAVSTRTSASVGGAELSMVEEASRVEQQIRIAKMRTRTLRNIEAVLSLRDFRRVLDEAAAIQSRTTSPSLDGKVQIGKSEGRALFESLKSHVSLTAPHLGSPV